MKKALSIFGCAALLLTLAGCNKKETLNDGESAPQSANSIVTSAAENSSENVESPAKSSDKNSGSTAPSDITPQKISELREDIANQINVVKGTKYDNLHITEDFVVKLPDADTLYDLTLTRPAADFKTYYEKFDKTFDREFGDIYTQEDKERLYHVYTRNMSGGEYNTDEALLVKHKDKILSGEEEFAEIYVDTEKAYLAMFSFGNGIYGLNHDGTIRRANPDEEPKYVAVTTATRYFEMVKYYLDLDSEDKYALLDKEVSIKEAVETAKKITAENEYSWGGSLEPNVYQVSALDIGEGKYGLFFSMTPSYKGVLFDTTEMLGYWGAPRKTDNLDHDYQFSPAQAFMMEDGKFDAFEIGESSYTAEETAEYDSVIPLDEAVRIASKSFGLGISLSVSRAELFYSAMYCVNEKDNSVMRSFPVWKFRCHNETDDYKYIIYVNAINGNVEYYLTDWWEI